VVEEVKMDWNKYKQKIFWVVITVLLGAIGSGLWEIALKPASLWVVNFALDSFLQLSNKLSDAVYTDLARGKAERIGITLLSWGAGFVMGIWIALVIKQQRRENGVFSKPPSNISLYLAALFICSFTAVNTFKTLFILAKINKFEQLVVITTPYLINGGVSKSYSEFGQIHKKEDYERIVKSLQLIAKSNKLYLPERLKD
jgi:hypothetical protein